MSFFVVDRKMRFLIKQHKKSIQWVLFMYAQVLYMKGKNFIHVCSILCMKRKIFICEEKMKENNSIYKRALMLAIPMMIQNGITNMVSLIDNVMVGSLGTESMTAVSIVGQLIFVFNLAIFGGMSGPGIYGAQYYGQGDLEGFRNTFRMKIWIGFCCLILGLTIFTGVGDSLIGLYLQGESQTIDATATLHYGLQYLEIMVFGLLPFVITQIYSSSLRETGCSIKPMIAGVCSVVVDVVFNYFLIYGKWIFPELGVQGAAIATVFARIVEMMTVIILAHKDKEEHKFLQGMYCTILVPVNMAKKIVKKTIPIFLNEFMWAGALAALTQCYSVRGLEVVAGLNISNALCNLLNVVFVALGSAVGILVGQTLGSSDYEQAKKDSLHLTLFTGLISSGLMVILLLISGVFPQLYDVTEQVKRDAVYFIRLTALFFPVQGVLNAIYFTLRSGGKTFITFLFDSVYSWCVTLPVALLLCYGTSLSVFVIYILVQAFDLIKVFIGCVLIKKGSWISNIIESI